jgi:hypothetical protein
MSVELQRQVLDYARVVAAPRPTGEPGRNLLRFAGLLDPDSLREMKESIEAGCERVDQNEW